MFGKAIKHLALGFISGEIADQGALGRVFPELLDLGQIVLES